MRKGSRDSGIDIQGAGLDVFMSLSASVLKVWARSVSHLIGGDDDVESSFSSFSSRLADGILRSSDEVLESPNEAVSRPVRGHRGVGIDFDFLPAPLRLALGLVDLVHALGPALLWGILLGGGFRLLRSSVRGRTAGTEGLDIGWLLVPSSVDLGSSTVSFVGGTPVRSTVLERRGAEVLFERLSGRKAIGGALSSGYLRSTGAVHGGWDLRMQRGTELRWPFDEEGVVVRATEHREGGRQLHVRTSSQEWGFAHLDSNTVVPVGTVLRRGDLFAISGSSGVQSNGRPMPAHLHINVKSLTRLGESYASDRMRRLSHERIEDAMQLEGVDLSALDVDISAYGASSMVAFGGVSGDVSFGSKKAAEANNPFNIMRSGRLADKWEGEVGITPLSMGRRLVKFSDPVYATRAAARTLLRYQEGYDISKTGGRGVLLGDVARKYVYGNLGDTPTYAGDDADRWADTVSSISGLPRDVMLDLRDEDTLVALLEGIARMETGSRVGRDVLQRGVSMATQSFGVRYNEQVVRAVGSNVQKF